MIIDLKEQINSEQKQEAMIALQKMFHSSCDVCGKVTEDVVVCSSSFGPFSMALCKDCLAQGKEPYSVIVGYIAMAGRFPEAINEEYQKEVRRQLTLHGISEEQFIADVNKAIEDFYG